MAQDRWWMQMFKDYGLALAPLKEGVPDPLSDDMKAGMWYPQTQEAQQQLVDEFNKKYNL